MSKPKTKEIKINVDSTLKAVYSNLTNITFNNEEFSLMFVHTIPQTPIADAKAIVTMNPEQILRLSTLLSDQIAIYESQFGHIRKIPKNNTPQGVEIQ
ncbi:MAG: DUF3467 domain-containing protein [Candidatus Peribacteraceae bacterium]|nr:DUF3467 domain-containing protein [Candidatus Peribacteraceae bacterium]